MHGSGLINTCTLTSKYSRSKRAADVLKHELKLTHIKVFIHELLIPFWTCLLFSSSN